MNEHNPPTPKTAGAVPNATPPHKLLTLAREYLVASTGNYIVHLVTGTTDPSAINVMCDETESLAKAYGKVGYFSVLYRTANLNMSKDLRARIEAMVTRFSPIYQGAAIVYDGHGFAATAARSTVTSVNLSTQSSHPTRVFSEVDSALMWLTGLAKTERTSKELRALVSTLYGKLSTPTRSESRSNQKALRDALKR
ncbi:MAG TPA: hypothetical protein VHM70_15605 [Polyangiaceae bacterium]|jgi:hypothetical protein|nr:hypothetical protein [Polyangiaceae bacterium]